MELETIRQLFTALALGTLIGLERERAKYHERNTRFAGIRTFALMALFGTTAVLVSKHAPVLFWILTGGFLLFVIAAYVTNSLMTKSVGATTEFAALFVYFIGVLIAQGKYTIATTLALLLLMILYFKDPLHHLAATIKKEELLSTVKFMIIAFVILPLLPNATYGPFDVLNPYLIWLMVVFISSISFISYIAIKFIGQKRGIGLTGFLAGFVSSTALTMSFSEQSQENKHVVNPYVFAVILASSAMFFRILIEVFVLNRVLVASIIFPMVVMGITGLAGAYYFFRKKDNTDNKHITASTAELKSPFLFKPALQFGVLFAFVLFISKAAEQLFGTEGIYVTSILSGLMDVDAITVSMANLAKDGLSKDIAAKAITIAAIMNTLAKGVIFYAFGHRIVAKKIAAVFGLVLVMGAITLLFPI